MLFVVQRYLVVMHLTKKISLAVRIWWLGHIKYMLGNVYTASNPSFGTQKYLQVDFCIEVMAWNFLSASLICSLAKKWKPNRNVIEKYSDTYIVHFMPLLFNGPRLLECNFLGSEKNLWERHHSQFTYLSGVLYLRNALQMLKAWNTERIMWFSDG